MKKYIGAGVAAFGLCAIIAGAFMGQVRGVYIKAILVCLECIGLG